MLNVVGNFIEHSISMKKSILYSTLFFAFIWGGRLDAIDHVLSPPQPKEDTSNFSVIRFSKSNHFMFDKSYKPTSLSKTEIQALQMLLEKFVAEHNAFLKMDTTLNSLDLNLDLRQYKRQFIPALNQKGEKEVFVTCICLEDIPGLIRSKINWRKDVFKMNDGGKCYFLLFINLNTKQYRNFTVNGT